MSRRRSIVPPTMGALSHIRICDFTGQLAGAGATRCLAAFGAQVIRIEDPVTQGPVGHPPRHAAVRRRPPRHRVRRRLQQPQRREARHHAQPAHRAGQGAAARAGARSRDVVTENFAAGVLERLGLRLRAAAGDQAPTSSTCRTAGSANRARTARSRRGARSCRRCCGLTFTSGLPDMPPAGLGLLLHGPPRRLLHGRRDPRRRSCHRNRTGEGQWVDMSCTEAGAVAARAGVLDYTVNGRPHAARRRARLQPRHAPADGAARHLPGRGRRRLGRDRLPRRRRLGAQLAAVIGEPWAASTRASPRSPVASSTRTSSTSASTRWTRPRDRVRVAAQAPGGRRARPPPCSGPRSASTTTPAPRPGGCGRRSTTPRWATSASTAFPSTSRRPTGRSSAAAPLLGEHNDQVFGELLGLSATEIASCDEGRR